jgi:hypothetical protein
MLPFWKENLGRMQSFLTDKTKNKTILRIKELSELTDEDLRELEKELLGEEK